MVGVASMDPASGLFRTLQTLKIVDIDFPSNPTGVGHDKCNQVSVRFVADQISETSDATEEQKSFETSDTERFVLVESDAQEKSRIEWRGRVSMEEEKTERLLNVTFDAPCYPKELIFNTTTGAITAVMRPTGSHPTPRLNNVLHGVCYGARKLIPGTNIALQHSSGKFVRVIPETSKVYLHRRSVLWEEIFSVVTVAAGSNAVGLRSMCTGKFLRWEGDEEQDALSADGVGPGHYSSWLEEPVASEPQGQIALKSAADGKYATIFEDYDAEYDVDSHCVVLRPGQALSSSSRFTVVPVVHEFFRPEEDTPPENSGPENGNILHPIMKVADIVI